jgi:hypothetical protein
MMIEVPTPENILPDMMPRAEWAAKKGKTDRTVRRWQDAGLIVVAYVGRDPYVVLSKTAARLRGEDRPSRGRKPKAA